MGSGGKDARTLLAAEGLELFSQPAWSPDSERIAFVRYRIAEAGLEASLETVAAAGNAPVVKATLWRMSIEDSPPVGEAAIAWMPDGRVLMARGPDLYAVEVDSATGEPAGEARRLTSWKGFDLHELSVSSGGGRVSFQNKQLQSDIYVGKLGDGGRRLLPPERLTLDDGRDTAPVWAHDSSAILFHTDRQGSLDIYRQGIPRRQSRAVVSGPGSQMVPGVSPDGSWILYWRVPPASGDVTEPWRLMRTPAGGGTAETVLETTPTSGRPRFACATAPSGICILAERKGGLLVFSLFNPAEGRGPQRATVPVSGGNPPVTWWDLAPDGERLALLEQSGRIRVLDLDGTLVSEATLQGAGGLERLTWTAGGDGLFVIGRDPGAILLHAGLDGETVVLWETTRTRFLEMAASPDGSRLAVAVESLDSDIWMVEGL
jgi:dipeptidyl aminopeptidase/acylaminoacyl peptidase